MKGRKLSRRKHHRSAMLANLASSLIIHGRVKTTDAKAKEIRPYVERMVTFAKRGDLHARRIVLSRLKDSIAVKKLFEEIGPRYTDRFGGYTRILKLGFRHGDNAPVSLIEFVEDEVTNPKNAKASKKKTTKKTSQAAAPKAAVEDAVVEEETTDKVATEAVVEEAAAPEVTPEAAPEETKKSSGDKEQDKAE